MPAPSGSKGQRQNQRSAQRPNQRPNQRQGSAPQRSFPVVPVVLGGIVLLAVIAIVITSLGGGSKTPTAANGTTLAQNRPVTVSGAALPKFTDAPSDPAVGMTAPTINGQSFDGTPVTITNDGSPKVILFVAHWCPHCQKEVPLLSEWMQTHQLPAGLKLYTVSTGVSESAPNFPPSAWLQREKWRVPTIADDTKTTAADQYGLSGYPYFVAVDGAGKVVTRTSGEIPISQWEDVLARTAGSAAPAG